MMAKKTIRKGVFETNSSSMHSLSIVQRDDAIVPFDQPLTVSPGEFGWGQERLSRLGDKLSYILTHIQYVDKTLPEWKWGKDNNKDEVAEALFNSKYAVWLQEMYKEQTGKELAFKAVDNYQPQGYIDHQSIGDVLPREMWEDEDSFKHWSKEIVFNYKYRIYIDNDNH